MAKELGEDTKEEAKTVHRVNFWLAIPRKASSNDLDMPAGIYLHLMFYHTGIIRKLNIIQVWREKAFAKSLAHSVSQIHTDVFGFCFCIVHRDISDLADFLLMKEEGNKNSEREKLA